MAGKLYVVGIGPGSYEDMTIRAARILQESQVIAGYTVYVDLIREQLGDKEFLATPMKQEVDRCRAALAKAAEGKQVAMVCSGDPGIYGMAGLVLELAGDYPQVEIEIVPGVTAACTGGACLGAPLIHDFAVISLSDLLTPWEKIERRLDAAAAADFVICLYNPSSRKRADYLSRACGIILESRTAATVCGIVRNIGREGESCRILSLGELKDIQTDMFTTVFIGNSATKEINGRMVTPRGYKNV